MKITVIGCGNTGQAASAYLAHLGAEVCLFSRSKEKAQIISQQGITSTGAVEGSFTVKGSSNPEEALRDCEVVLVMTTANGHLETAKRIKPYLQEGQSILVFNSNWGALEFKQVLGDLLEPKNLTLAETASQLFLASSPEVGKVHFNLKQSISLSATEKERTEELIEKISVYFPQFTPANSVIETSLSATNPVIHVPIALLNLVRITKGQPFLFYGEGVTEGAVELILALDKERIEVGKKLGFTVTDVLSGINGFWEIKHDNLYDALTKNESYIKGFAPTSLEHRYITEDVYYGIVPIAKIGELYDVPTPTTDALLKVFSVVLGEDVLEKGVSFTKQDLE